MAVTVEAGVCDFPRRPWEAPRGPLSWSAELQRGGGLQERHWGLGVSDGDQGDTEGRVEGTSSTPSGRKVY